MSSLKETFGERVRARRKELGMTQADLAKATGIHQPDICVLESGEHAPNLDTVERVAKALKIDHKILLTD